jgi:2-polyprenyl-3-methyl-5-hydroxy-6-metoxy-1,4-benzoquinol methylase
MGPDYYSTHEYRECLVNLFQINQLLGISRDTVNVLKKYPAGYTLLDVGCGGGLFLLDLRNYFPALKMTGCDVSAEAISNAKENVYQDANINFQLQDKNELTLASNQYDFILITLVCHHLTDTEIIAFLQTAYTAASSAVIINDLHRHPLSWLFYKLLCPLFFKNRLIRHDGLVSITRSFVRADWISYLNKAGITDYTLRWRFPFRWQLILMKQ